MLARIPGRALPNVFEQHIANGPHDHCTRDQHRQARNEIGPIDVSQLKWFDPYVYEGGNLAP
jgi:hypothetical protein